MLRLHRKIAANQIQKNTAAVIKNMAITEKKKTNHHVTTIVARSV